jgi:uncharacterized protein YdhG (YjbR/CyaY superfamily)
MNKPKSIDEYLASVPPEQRAALEKLRKQIKEAAPGAVEGISWGVPVFKVEGKYVAGFAAYKKHLSFAPWGGWSGLISEKELEGYEHTAGTIHFTPEKMLPVSLVRKLVKAKIKENEARGT